MSALFRGINFDYKYVHISLSLAVLSLACRYTIWMTHICQKTYRWQQTTAVICILASFDIAVSTVGLAYIYMQQCSPRDWYQRSNIHVFISRNTEIISTILKTTTPATVLCFYIQLIEVIIRKSADLISSYSNITSTKSPSLCVVTFSASLTHLTSLLPQSHECSWYVSRTLTPPPIWLR